MSKYRKLAKQPLVFALAEFRFSQVLQMEKYIPQLQEALRKTYPLPEVIQEQAIQVNPAGIEVTMKSRWAFISGDRKHGVTIDPDRLIYFTTNYPRFKGFAESCISALRPLLEIVEPELLLRIGLRYGDLIKISDGEALEDYVDPYFGYPKLAQPLGVPEHQRDEVVIRTDTGRLLIRSLYGVNGFVSSPDLQGIPILPKPDPEPSERIILDFDHIWSASDEPVPFELGGIEDILTKLHGTARDAFWRITTDQAKDTKWN